MRIIFYFCLIIIAGSMLAQSTDTGARPATGPNGVGSSIPSGVNILTSVPSVTPNPSPGESPTPKPSASPAPTVVPGVTPLPSPQPNPSAAARAVENQ